MDTNFLKLTWKVNIPEWLKNDNNYSIALQWSITNCNISSNQDWTFTNTYSFRPIHCLIHDELGETIKAKDIRSNSERLRAYLFRKYNNDHRLLEKYNTFSIVLVFFTCTPHDDLILESSTYLYDNL